MKIRYTPEGQRNSVEVTVKSLQGVTILDNGDEVCVALVPGNQRATSVNIRIDCDRMAVVPVSSNLIQIGVLQ